MSGKKLWHVSVTLEIDMVVAAEDKHAAEVLGREHWSAEAMGAGIEPYRTSVSEVEDRGDLNWLGDVEIECGAVYGADGTIQEALDRLGIK